jgi:hypothetical protein
MSLRDTRENENDRMDAGQLFSNDRGYFQDR